jgi:hypothetical protein
MPKTADPPRPAGRRSSRRAALDHWLDRADDVLATQRARSISPTNEGWDGPARTAWTVSVSELRASLAGLLDRLTSAPGRWLVILEIGPEENPYYVQFIAYEDGSLIAEAVSDHYLPPNRRIGEQGSGELRRMGWLTPLEGGNWRLVEDTVAPDVPLATGMAIAALTAVYGAGEDAPVRAALFDSPRRGKTPAEWSANAGHSGDRT